MITERIPVDGYNTVIHFTDTNFSAFIALHDLQLGVALGGCRIKPYANDQEALEDALRLSKGMSYKNSLAGLKFGGGKCVVNAEHATPELMHKIGEAVEYMDGQYVTAEDVGTSVEDIRVLSEKTSFVASLGHAGDPSPWTAIGVFEAIEAARAYMGWEDSYSPSVWLQGLGKVGWDLAERLHHDGYQLYVSDLNQDRVDEAVAAFGAWIYDENDPDMCNEIDIYAPCAMGNVIRWDNIQDIDFPVICGSANNQLESDELADELYRSHVVYCPDYLVNAGGVIALAAEQTVFSMDNVLVKVKQRGDLLTLVLETAELLNMPPLRVANALAEFRWT
jgi:leucine dehydrogenase